MAATNINRVVLTGNLTRDPELRSTVERHVRLLAAGRLQHPPQGPVDRRVGGQAQLLRRHGLGRPGRELRALPREGPPGGDRRPPRVARVDTPEGNKRQAVDIIADAVQFLGGRDDGAAAAATASRRGPTSRPTRATSRPPARPPAGGGGAQRRRRRHPVLDRPRRLRRGRRPRSATLSGGRAARARARPSEL